LERPPARCIGTRRKDNSARVRWSNVVPTTWRRESCGDCPFC
jgi:hypothetical protein